MTEALMRQRLVTSDPEEAHAWLRSFYSDHQVTLSGRVSGFRFSHSRADCAGFTVGMWQHSMSVTGSTAPVGDKLVFAHQLAGHRAVRTPRSEVAIGPGDVVSIDPDSPMAVEWDTLHTTQVCLDRDVAQRVAAEIAEDDRARSSLRFDLAHPLSESRAVHWKRLVRYVTRDVVMNPHVHTSPLVMRQVLRLVVATAVDTFPQIEAPVPTTPAATSPASPAAVRRAIALIDEQAGTDLDLTAIAEAAQVGPRALQRAFRRSMDTTPLGYLRSVRMDRAHEELRAAGPGSGVTVGGVAIRWGFGHPGRFAADYRHRYGVTPSDTLRG